MTSAQKDTIYIDIDDEITSIIDKLEASPHKIVALVLPKRAAVLQSLVNMKLLKRSAEEANKSLVLITSEASLMPLAGSVGVHVAKTLQSKPAVPIAPKITDSTVDVSADEVDDVDLDKTAPIGALAGFDPGDKDSEETIELDNTDDKPAEKPDDKKSGKAKTPLNKKLKVPDFNKFRTRLFLGIGGFILLLLLWYLAAFVMPRSNIVLKTDTSNESADISFTAKPDVTEVNLADKVVPSKPFELKKSDNEKVAATGEKDNGNKASGTMTLKNCIRQDGSVTLSAGSVFTDSGLNFLTTEAVSLPASSFSGSGACTTATKNVPVIAQNGGEKYNLSARSYTFSASPSIQANGSAMTGGTTDIIKVVSQKDVDDARKKIEERTNSAVESELITAIEAAGYYALKESLIVGTPEFTPSPAVGEQASEVTVTSNITYIMIGVKEEDLSSLVVESVKDKLQDGKQEVQSNGLDQAVIRLSDKQPEGNASGTIQTIIVIGPKFDLEALKRDIAGKSRSQTNDTLKAQPGVQEVIIDYSPFWVFSTPKQPGKISITLEQANTSGEE